MDQLSSFVDDGVVLVIRQPTFALNSHALKAFDKGIHASLVQESSNAHESKVNFTTSSIKSEKEGKEEYGEKYIYFNGQSRMQYQSEQSLCIGFQDLATRSALAPDLAGFIRASVASLAICTTLTQCYLNEQTFRVTQVVSTVCYKTIIYKKTYFNILIPPG
ncbi:hypothetical protein NPIL_533151 [Nephila pilipes]|uniref:Uncharacterized protein n=1 Tax=Nephila pilipes TaxID=299642 RepID=A0A8X6TQB3_NEPPI|nr:hypothetical protein NPIL_533151 [Nephila pilipes]